MMLVRAILFFTLFLAAAFPFSDAEAGKKKTVSERVSKLEKKINENAVFVSDGRLILFGIDVPTKPTTEEDRKELEEDSGE